MSSPADFQKHEKSQKICLKTLVKSSCILNANFNDFCLHFGSQNPSKKLSALQIFSTFSSRHVQDAPKTPQDASKTPPRRLQDPPRSLQDASKTPQDAARTPLDNPKTPPSCLKLPWNTPRILQNWKFWKSSNFLCFHPIFLHFSCFQASHGEEKGRPLWVSNLFVKMYLQHIEIT